MHFLRKTKALKTAKIGVLRAYRGPRKRLRLWGRAGATERVRGGIKQDIKMPPRTIRSPRRRGGAYGIRNPNGSVISCQSLSLAIEDRLAELLEK